MTQGAHRSMGTWGWLVQDFNDSLGKHLRKQAQAISSFSGDQERIALYSSPKQDLQGELVRVTGSPEVF